MEKNPSSNKKSTKETTVLDFKCRECPRELLYFEEIPSWVYQAIYTSYKRNIRLSLLSYPKLEKLYLYNTKVNIVVTNSINLTIYTDIQDLRVWRHRMYGTLTIIKINRKIIRNSNGITKPIGVHKKWYEDGNRKSEYYYGRNGPVGIQRSWYDNGQLETSKFYSKSNRLVGTSKSFYKNGKQKTEINYNKKGKLHGSYKTWDENGKLINNYYYIEGSKQYPELMKKLNI